MSPKEEPKIREYHLIMPNEEVFITELSSSEIYDVINNLLKVDTAISGFDDLNPKVKKFLDKEKPGSSKARKHLNSVFHYSQDLNDACYLLQSSWNGRKIFCVRAGEGPVQYGTKEDFWQYFSILDPAVEDYKALKVKAKMNEKDNMTYII